MSTVEFAAPDWFEWLLLGWCEVTDGGRNINLRRERLMLELILEEQIYHG